MELSSLKPWKLHLTVSSTVEHSRECTFIFFVHVVSLLSHFFLSFFGNCSNIKIVSVQHPIQGFGFFTSDSGTVESENMSERDSPASPSLRIRHLTPGCFCFSENNISLLPADVCLAGSATVSLFFKYCEISLQICEAADKETENRRCQAIKAHLSFFFLRPRLPLTARQQ